MCMVCVEYMKGNLTKPEAMRALKEIAIDDPDHAIVAEQTIIEDEDT